MNLEELHYRIASCPFSRVGFLHKGSHLRTSDDLPIDPFLIEKCYMTSENTDIQINQKKLIFLWDGRILF
jgi:hypothetical protein